MGICKDGGGYDIMIKKKKEDEHIVNFRDTEYMWLNSRDHYYMFTREEVDNARDRYNAWMDNL